VADSVAWRESAAALDRSGTVAAESGRAPKKDETR